MPFSGDWRAAPLATNDAPRAALPFTCPYGNRPARLVNFSFADHIVSIVGIGSLGAV